MAQAEDIDTDEDGGEEKKQGGKKMLIIIIGVVLLLAGGGGAAYFFGLLDSVLGKKDAATEHAADGEAPAEEAHAEPKLDEHGNPIPDPNALKTSYYDMPDFLVNLSTNTNQTSFLKMKVTLKLPSEKDLELAQQKLPELQDHFNTYLRDLRATDLGGSAGMYRLREELLARANKTMSPAKVEDILFREILVQ